MKMGRNLPHLRPKRPESAIFSGICYSRRSPYFFDAQPCDGKRKVAAGFSRQRPKKIFTQGPANAV